MSLLNFWSQYFNIRSSSGPDPVLFSLLFWVVVCSVRIVLRYFSLPPNSSCYCFIISAYQLFLFCFHFIIDMFHLSFKVICFHVCLMWLLDIPFSFFSSSHNFSHLLHFQCFTFLSHCLPFAVYVNIGVYRIFISSHCYILLNVFAMSFCVR